MAWQRIYMPDDVTPTNWEYNDSPADPGDLPEQAAKKAQWLMKNGTGYSESNGKKSYYQIRYSKI